MSLKIYITEYTAPNNASFRSCAGSFSLQDQIGLSNEMVDKWNSEGGYNSPGYTFKIIEYVSADTVFTSDNLLKDE